MTDKKEIPIELIDVRLRAIWSAREVVVSAARECARELQGGDVDAGTVEVLVAALGKLDAVSEWGEPLPEGDA